MWTRSCLTLVLSFLRTRNFRVVWANARMILAEDIVVRSEGDLFWKGGKLTSGIMCTTLSARKTKMVTCINNVMHGNIVYIYIFQTHDVIQLGRRKWFLKS